MTPGLQGLASTEAEWQAFKGQGVPRSSVDGPPFSYRVASMREQELYCLLAHRRPKAYCSMYRPSDHLAMRANPNKAHGAYAPDGRRDPLSGPLQTLPGSRSCERRTPLVSTPSGC